MEVPTTLRLEVKHAEHPVNVAVQFHIELLKSFLLIIYIYFFHILNTVESFLPSSFPFFSLSPLPNDKICELTSN